MKKITKNKYCAILLKKKLYKDKQFSLPKRIEKNIYKLNIISQNIIIKKPKDNKLNKKNTQKKYCTIL